MAATVKHLKQFDKIFLGIRENADEKLAHLKSEFLDHQEWLRKAVVDTKESKYGCPPGLPAPLSMSLCFCIVPFCPVRGAATDAVLLTAGATSLARVSCAGTGSASCVPRLYERPRAQARAPALRTRRTRRMWTTAARRRAPSGA